MKFGFDPAQVGDRYIFLDSTVSKYKAFQPIIILNDGTPKLLHRYGSHQVGPSVSYYNYTYFDDDTPMSSSLNYNMVIVFGIV